MANHLTYPKTPRPRLGPEARGGADPQRGAHPPRGAEALGGPGEGGGADPREDRGGAAAEDRRGITIYKK